MATKIIMPELGESVIEGTVVSWLKQEGDTVSAGEPLLVVETDKVTVEVPSNVTGVLLKAIAAVNQTIAVGEALCWVGQAGEALDETPTLAIEPNATQSTPDVSTPPTEHQSKRTFISPVVGRIAQEYQIDLTHVQGTGQQGRIMKKDVMAYLETRQHQPPLNPPHRGGSDVLPPMGGVRGGLISVLSSSESELLPLTSMRRKIAQHMVHSKQTAPHVTTVLEADLHKMMTHYRANKALFAQDGTRLTLTAYFLTACGQALKRHPMVNASWSEQGILLHKGVNIGLATDLGERGLIVPVIKQVSDLSLRGAARSIDDIVTRARSSQLNPDDVSGGTFTITNYGINGPLFATPIINQPQCAILGVGLIQKRVIVLEQDGSDIMAIRPMVYLAMTFDHRILDGATADAFLRDVIEQLESWG